VKLIVKTLKPLPVASGEGGFFIETTVTDAVTKKLSKVEYGVFESLGANLIPLHTLCKSHACGKLDEACIKALVGMESEVDYPN